MKSFFFLRSSTGEAKIIFYVIDVTFNDGSYFVDVIPFLCATKYTGICT